MPYPWMMYDRPSYGFLFLLLALWSLFWKAMALWKSGRNGEKAWFIVMLIVNTVGILEILYLFVFSKPKGLPQDLLPKSMTPPSKPSAPEPPKQA